MAGVEEVEGLMIEVEIDLMEVVVAVEGRMVAGAEVLMAEEEDHLMAVGVIDLMGEEVEAEVVDMEVVEEEIVEASMEILETG